MIGRLRHRIEILAMSRTPDEAGGATLAWTPVETLWAGLQHLAASERNSASRIDRLKRVAATVRYRTNLTLGQRVRFADDDYDIVSIETADGAARFLTLVCEEARP